VEDMVDIDALVENTVKTYGKYIDEDLDIYNGNRYLTVKIESLLHEALKGVFPREMLSELAMKLRDALLEGPGNVNPYVMEILGILEESSSEENIREALELSRRLLKEDRFEKLEV
jgi:predicted nuclease of restriction endonuclease-like (RecB) superfamily